MIIVIIVTVIRIIVTVIRMITMVIRMIAMVIKMMMNTFQDVFPHHFCRIECGSIIVVVMMTVIIKTIVIVNVSIMIMYICQDDDNENLHFSGCLSSPLAAVASQCGLAQRRLQFLAW